MKRRRPVEREARRQETQIFGVPDRRAAEAFGLELRMLAKACGLDVASVEITTSKRSPKTRSPRSAVGSGADRLDAPDIETPPAP